MATVVLLSGGMDSAVALAWAKRESADRDNVSALFVDYGQMAAQAELAAAASVASYFNVWLRRASCSLVGGITNRVGDFGIASDAVVPARNLVLMSVAASIVHDLGGGDVVIGCCAADSESFPDCRESTLVAMGGLFLSAGINAKIVAPVVSKTKAEIVAAARDGGFLGLIQKDTVSCYLGRVPGCGRCHACAARAVGFEEAGCTQ